MKVKRSNKKIISKQSKSRLKQLRKKSFKKSRLGNRKKTRTDLPRLQKRIFFGSPKMAQNVTNEKNTIKLVKRLLGDDTIDAIPGCDDDANLLQDLDLLVLGSSTEEYKRYTELLRKEYAHLDDCSYKKMRLKHNDPRPSTSRKAAESRSTRSPSTSPNRTLVKKKPFVKFKDDKHRIELMEKYKLSSRRRFPFKANGVASPSLSQAISRKIVHQIKKRQNNNNTPSKFVIRTMQDNPSQKVVEEKPSTSDDLDDDCVCIETKTEVILIDDESVAPVNVVKELENKYLQFKQYQAIGSIRMNQNQAGKHMPILTSTPNIDRGKTSSRVPFHEETDSRFGSTSSDTICCNSEDVAVVEDVNGQFDDIIVIDDTIIPRTRLPKRRRIHRPKIDDSVIFVKGKISRNSSIVPPAPAFIPLDTPTEEVKIRLPPIPKSPPRPRRKCRDLFTTREEKQLRQYNDNAYNPNKDAPKEQPKKRMVIVDGSNVAYHHSLMKEFSVKGLKICLDYFDKIGHEVKAVVPQHRLQRQRSSDPDELEKLHRAGKIVFTPCKNLPGKSSTSYDDRFVLQLASELDAAIVSNDNYRDLINENSAFKKIIENRVIGYTWCNDIFILPKDPYGRSGPQLDAILNRS